MMPHLAGCYTSVPSTVFDVWVAWTFFVVGAAFALLAANAWVPARREPLTVVSFVFGSVPAELPLHLIVVEAAVAAALSIAAGLSSWPAVAGLALTVASAVGFAGLAAVAHRTGALVDSALDGATGGPVVAPGTDLRPAWSHWWRLVLAVPLRFRGIRKTRGIDYWGDGDDHHRLDILYRRDAPPEGAPVLVYIHGGGWVMGDKREQGLPMMHELARRGWVCVTVNYRLSPRATWPAHVVDCKRALAWVREHIAEHGGDPAFIALSGGSAGGHLAALAALTPNRPEWQPGFEEADTSVDACIPFYGVYDMTVEPDAGGAYGRGLARLLVRRVMKASIDDDRTPFEEASPDRRITPGAPPMFVIHGANDTLASPRMARRFVDRLRELSAAPVAYLELPRTQHAFEVMVTIRSRHTTLGAVRFLEGIRSRVSR